MKLVCAILGLLLSQLAIAIPVPEKCPEVAAIQAYGLHKYNIERHGDAWIVNLFRHSFGTKSCWEFNTNPFNAKDVNDAVKKAKNIMTSLHYISGPSSSGEKYVCRYKDQNNTHAFATYPTFYACYD